MKYALNRPISKFGDNLIRLHSVDDDDVAWLHNAAQKALAK